MLLVIELLVLAVVQTAWLVVYQRAFGGASPLAPVWISKGFVLVLLWLLLAANEVTRIPGLVWVLGIGPLLIIVNVAWLVATLRIARHLRR
ncbi:MAG: hypothetical protein HOQ45_11915 [Nocardioidaceae bacterium]|nr:hypothetical protein [Nocardioidaceae bacterium]